MEIECDIKLFQSWTDCKDYIPQGDPYIMKFGFANCVYHRESSISKNGKCLLKEIREFLYEEMRLEDELFTI